MEGYWLRFLPGIQLKLYSFASPSWLMIKPEIVHQQLQFVPLLVANLL